MYFCHVTLSTLLIISNFKELIMIEHNSSTILIQPSLHITPYLSADSPVVRRPDGGWVAPASSRRNVDVVVGHRGVIGRRRQRRHELAQHLAEKSRTLHGEQLS